MEQDLNIVRKEQSQSKKTRVTVDLTPQLYDRLEELEDLVGAESKASMIRQALQLYEWCAKKTIAGNVFQVVTPDGQTTEVVLLGPNYPLCRSNQ
jgi:propanediol utilization protein